MNEYSYALQKIIQIKYASYLVQLKRHLSSCTIKIFFVIQYGACTICSMQEYERILSYALQKIIQIKCVHCLVQLIRHISTCTIKILLLVQHGTCTIYAMQQHELILFYVLHSLKTTKSSL